MSSMTMTSEAGPSGRASAPSRDSWPGKRRRRTGCSLMQASRLPSSRQTRRGSPPGCKRGDSAPGCRERRQTSTRSCMLRARRKGASTPSITYSRTPSPPEGGTSRRRAWGTPSAARSSTARKARCRSAWRCMPPCSRSRRGAPGPSCPSDHIPMPSDRENQNTPKSSRRHAVVRPPAFRRVPAELPISSMIGRYLMLRIRGRLFTRLRAMRS